MSAYNLLELTALINLKAALGGPEFINRALIPSPSPLGKREPDLKVLSPRARAKDEGQG
jgi:hypothetical protein